MAYNAQKILDRLAGRDEKDLARIRRMTYYDRWKSTADWLDSHPSKKAILYAIHRARDERGYGYAWKSEKSKEALRLVCDERGLTFR